MNLKTTDLKHLHDIAIQAAKKAGEVIANYDRNKLKVHEKEGAVSRASEVVTEVDFLCQAAIVNELQHSIETFDLALLTEETTDDKSRFEKDYFWCIDPIDGTLPYIENRPGYSIVISLISKSGEAQLGVIFDPVTQIDYSAIKGNGAFINGNQWERTETKSDKFVFVFDRSFFKDSRFSETIAAIKEFAMNIGFTGVEKVQYGGAAMNAVWLAQQNAGCYLKYPQEKGGSIWDYGASNCIYKELGLPVSDIFGHDMELNRPESTHMNHNGILFATGLEISKFAIDLAKKIK